MKTIIVIAAIVPCCIFAFLLWKETTAIFNRWKSKK